MHDHRLLHEGIEDLSYETLKNELDSEEVLVGVWLCTPHMKPEAEAIIDTFQLRSIVGVVREGYYVNLKIFASLNGSLDPADYGVTSE